MDRIKVLFNDLARKYDFFCRVASLSLDYFWRKKVGNFICKGDTVLDLCTGTGGLVFYFKKASRIIGIDFCSEMLNEASTKAQKKAGRHQSNPEISFICGDAEILPFSENSFDCITSSFAFRHLRKNLNTVLKEIHRVVKPQGKIMILEFSKPKLLFLRLGYYLYLRIFIPLLGIIIFGLKKINYFLYFKDTIINFFEPNELVERLRNGGFEQVKYIPLSGGIVGIYTGIRI